MEGTLLNGEGTPLTVEGTPLTGEGTLLPWRNGILQPGEGKPAYTLGKLTLLPEEWNPATRGGGGGEGRL